MRVDEEALPCVVCGAPDWPDRPAQRRGFGRQPAALTTCPACRENKRRMHNAAARGHHRRTYEAR